MPHVSFRFLHAADFRLEQPVEGLSDIPEPLRRALVDAPYRAAENVFRTAVREEVDFVVLSGNLVDPRRSGPRGPLFLCEQFEELNDRGIAVYWAGGQHDRPETWPVAFPTPSNVTFFPSDEVDEVAHHRDDGEAIACVLGASAGRRNSVPVEYFEADADGLFTIAAACGRADPGAMAARPIDYWALGGRRQRRTPSTGPRIVHWPGSPQGRRPDDIGAFGCSLVSVEDGVPRIATVPTHSLQWSVERLFVADHLTQDDLFLQAGERIEAIHQTSPNAELLVTWELEGRGPLLRKLARSGVEGDSPRNDLLRELGEEGAKRSPAVWSVAIRIVAPDVLPGEFYKQQSIRGDYLRTVSHYQMNPEEPIDLAPFVDAASLDASLEGIADLSTGEVRERILREAALLGVDLLSGEESQS